MTDEMTVQAQRPSALPYLAGGAVVGAAAGAGSAKYANFGISSPKYSNWEEAIKDSNDEFVKKQVEKGGDKKADWEKLQNSQKEVSDAQKKLDDAWGKDLKNNADVKDYIKKAEAFEKAEEKAIKDLEAKISKGDFDVKLEGDELAKKVAEDSEVKKAKANVPTTKNVQLTKLAEDKSLMVDADGKAIVDDAARLNKAKEILEAEAKEGDSEVVKNARKAISDAEENLSKAEKAAEEAINKPGKELKGEELTNRAKALLAEDKNKTDEYKNALKAKDEALEKAKKVEGFTDDIRKAVAEAEQGLKAAKDKAKNVLSDDLLKGLKAPSVLKTAGVGAILLGLGALLLRPKADEVV